MVKQRKVSKSAIAIVVLALLLVLSMVMGLTGAWFTDKVGNGDSKEIQFGKVALSANSLALEITSTEADLEHVVDKDTFTLPAASLTEASDVNVFVAVYKEKQLYRYDSSANSGSGGYVHVVAADKFEDGTTSILSCFKVSGSQYAGWSDGAWTVQYMASTATERGLISESEAVLEFDSAGAANDSNEQLKIVYKLYVVEIQAKNIASKANLLSELNTVAAGYVSANGIPAIAEGNLTTAWTNGSAAAALDGRSTTESV